jgi:hypothetical protein
MSDSSDTCCLVLRSGSNALKMLHEAPPKQRNLVPVRSLSTCLFLFLPMRKKRSLSTSTLEELPSGQRRLVNYMKEDQKTITTQRDTPCYEFHKVGLDPWFWSYFHAYWYRSTYKRKHNLVVPMQWTDWTFMEQNKY